jgi:MoaA/NifB/PqqE/SkfB family radical SAM enzyme
MTNVPFLFDPKGKRIIQIHPSFACNLRCTHCYSSSGPSTAKFLSSSAILHFLKQARNIGYSYVGVSGGEPLLWPELHSFLNDAQSLGCSCAITSNGQLIDSNCAQTLKPKIDVVSVSFEGQPGNHDRIRGAGTFARAQAALDHLTGHGITTSIAFTLTKDNGSDLRWLYDFACDHKVKGFEVHPLIDIGRAKDSGALVPGSAELRAVAWLLAICVLDHDNAGPVAILDAIQRKQLMESSWLDAWRDLQNRRFCDLVPSLVVEPDGTIVPFMIGFPHAWAIGSVFSDNLEDLCQSWVQAHSLDIQSLIKSIVEKQKQQNIDYMDLFASLMLEARRTVEAGLTKAVR